MEDTKVLEQMVKLARLDQKQEKQLQKDIESDLFDLEKTDIKELLSQLSDEKSDLDHYDTKKTESDEESEQEFVQKSGVDKSQQGNGENGEETYQTKDFISLNRSMLQFGKLNIFPGSIQEIDLVINLKEHILEFIEDSKPLMLRVVAKCQNQQFEDLDQYVFSVRSNEKYQYFEEVRYKIRRKQKAQIKVAVKVPPVQQNYSVRGSLTIQLQNLVPLVVPISCRCVVPKINCIKNLYNHDQNSTVIKIPAKKNVTKMPPIPFKNLSNFNFPVQLELISHGDFSKRPYDVVCYGLINCVANGQFFVNVQLRTNQKYEGVKPLRDTIRKVLVMKVKNSSVLFHYPIEVHVYEGKQTSSS